MSIMTLEGIIENGQIKLKNHFHLPDKTKVFVIIPGIEVENRVHIFSPRLAKPEQAIDFKMEIIEEAPSANL